MNEEPRQLDYAGIDERDDDSRSKPGSFVGKAVVVVLVACVLAVASGLAFVIFALMEARDC